MMFVETKLHVLCSGTCVKRCASRVSDTLRCISYFDQAKHHVIMGKTSCFPKHQVTHHVLAGFRLYSNQLFGTCFQMNSSCFTCGRWKLKPDVIRKHHVSRKRQVIRKRKPYVSWPMRHVSIETTSYIEPRTSRIAAANII